MASQLPNYQHMHSSCTVAGSGGAVEPFYSATTLTIQRRNVHLNLQHVTESVQQICSCRRRHATHKQPHSIGA
jgi:hypothetical protein